jgi:nicotinamide riboside transporter PnuC
MFLGQYLVLKTILMTKKYFEFYKMGFGHIEKISSKIKGVFQLNFEFSFLPYLGQFLLILSAFSTQNLVTTPYTDIISIWTKLRKHRKKVQNWHFWTPT